MTDALQKKREYMRARRAADPEGERERRRAYRLANWDRIAEQKASYDRNRRLADPERKAAAGRAYYMANKERVAEYRQANAERFRRLGAQTSRRRRARLANADVRSVSDRDLRRLLTRQQGRCAYCGTALDDCHLDHVIPVSRGGRHAIGNLAYACGRCNRRKAAKLLVAWRQELGR